jgi:hypothetical protein
VGLFISIFPVDKSGGTYARLSVQLGNFVERNYRGKVVSSKALFPISPWVWQHRFVRILYSLNHVLPQTVSLSASHVANLEGDRV